MNIVVKKTNEMSLFEKKKICNLFFEVFGIVKGVDEFLFQFEKNEFEYSYFGLLYDGNDIVGSYAVIPFHYKYYKKNVIFGQSVDTMIKKEYRGNPFLLKKLANLTYSKLKEDGISFVFGFPNKDIYLVRKRILGWKDIDNLSVYIAPINMDKFYSRLRFLNIFAKYILSFLSFVAVRFKSEGSNSKNIKKTRTKSYLKYRYFSGYPCIKLDKETSVTYIIKIIKGIRFAIIVNLYPASKFSLASSVKTLSETLNNIDAVMYIGHIDKVPINIFKVPNFIDMNKINFCGKILNKDIVNNSIFDVNNWKVNVENFDWI